MSELRLPSPRNRSYGPLAAAALLVVALGGLILAPHGAHGPVAHGRLRDTLHVHTDAPTVLTVQATLGAGHGGHHPRLGHDGYPERLVLTIEGTAETGEGEERFTSIQTVTGENAEWHDGHLLLGEVDIHPGAYEIHVEPHGTGPSFARVPHGVTIHDPVAEERSRRWLETSAVLGILGALWLALSGLIDVFRHLPEVEGEADEHH